MNDMQEVRCVDRMMAHQAEQRSAVSLRITGTQAIGFIFIDTERIDNVLRHRAIDLGKNRVRRMMQGVVEIEQPNGAGR